MPPIVLAELAGSAQYGGGERYLELLCGRLDRNRFQPLLICPEPGPFVEAMQRRGIPTHVVTLAPLVNPLALFRLTKLLAREQVAILHTHGARANAYGRLAGRLAGVPIIVSTIHNSLRDYEVGSLKRGIYRTALRLTLPLVDRIICVSEALKKDLVEECPAAADRAVRVYNGIDTAQFASSGKRAETRQALGVGKGPMLLVIGRLTEQKGHCYLLQALPNLLATWPTLRCVFVGEGELRETLSALAARLGVAQACRFTGSREDIPDILAAADVVVLPSLSEGFPFVTLEALAAGRPVVASRVNGVPELLEEGRTGRLVPPKDAAALSVALREVLSDPDRSAAMAEEGRRLVRARFTADRMVEDTEAVFETLVHGRHDLKGAKSVAA